MTEAITILIADPHAIVRRGMYALFDAEPDMTIVAEAATGAAAVAQADGLHPDVLLLELDMPDLDGLTVLALLRESAPDTKVIILTTYSDNESVMTAVRAGAAGYLLKDASPGQLLQAIRAVKDGSTYLYPTLGVKLLRDAGDPYHLAAGRGSGDDESLTNRETQVLRLVALGYSNAQIAEALEISERTAGNHIGSILRKLRLTNRTQAALYALRRGMVDLRVAGDPAGGDNPPAAPL